MDQLEGDWGETVNLHYKTSVCLKLKEFKCIEYRVLDKREHLVIIRDNFGGA